MYSKMDDFQLLLLRFIVLNHDSLKLTLVDNEFGHGSTANGQLIGNGSFMTWYEVFRLKTLLIPLVINALRLLHYI